APTERSTHSRPWVAGSERCACLKTVAHRNVRIAARPILRTSEKSRTIREHESCETYRVLEMGGYSIMNTAQLLNIFAPESTPARAIVDFAMFVLTITGLIFVVVASLLVYAVVKFRATPANADREPAQVYGSTQIELAWTVVPVLIVVVLFAAT